MIPMPPAPISPGRPESRYELELNMDIVQLVLARECLRLVFEALDTDPEIVAALRGVDTEDLFDPLYRLERLLNA